MKNNIERLEGHEELFEMLLEKLLKEEIEWTRFDHKQAWFSNIINNRFRLLKSYNTIVVVIDITNHKYYELGKWSPTTSKQVTQFYNRYYSSFERYLVIS